MIYPEDSAKQPLSNWGLELGFSLVPRTFLARKVSCQTAIRLFWKANLLTCFVCKKNQEECEVWRLRNSALRRYRGNCVTRRRPEKFRDFWETVPWCPDPCFRLQNRDPTLLWSTRLWLLFAFLVACFPRWTCGVMVTSLRMMPRSLVLKYRKRRNVYLLSTNKYHKVICLFVDSTLFSR